MTHSFKENLMTTKDASELSGYTSDYLARLVRSGEIQGKRIGHSWVIDSASLEAFMTKQQGRKLDRARELASSRVREYNKHNQFVRRTTRALTKKISIPQFDFGQAALRAHVHAFGVAVMVVALGAVGAHAAAVPQVVARASALATEISSGFVDTFGIVPSRIAARMEEARTAVRADATRDVLASRRAGYVASPVLAAIDLETLRSVLVKEYRAPRAASDIARSPSRADAPILTAADVHASAVTAYAFLAHPASIGAALTDAYFAIGTDAYAAVDASFSAYRALVDDSGVAALALAATTRDMLARAPHAVAQVNLALGEAVVSATHAAIRTDVIVAHGLATAAPESARIAVTLMGSAGDTLARAAEQVPARVATAYLNATAVPAVLAPRLAQAIFGAEYAVASRFVSATSAVSERYLALVEGTGSLAYESSSTARSVGRSVSRAVAFAPAAIEDATLGALGKSAMALDSVTHLSSFAAVLPALSASEKTALAVYEAIHSVFDSANRSLVAFFSTTPETVLPTGVPKARVIAVATSTRPVASGTQSVTALSYPTYTTVVRGISEDFMNQSLASLRTNVLATVAGMIQPVSNQVVQNITTIQQLNRIDSLHDLVVENGDFRNSIFDSGIRVNARDGYFDSLTAGTTTLATTTINGGLAVTGGISTLSAVTAGHFVSTSTNATSTFAGSINIDNAGFVYATSTRNVGIGVLSPAALLAVQNSTSTQPIFVASNAAGAEVYRLTDAGFVGIGTTSPSYNLAVEGSSSLGTQAIAGYFTATTSTATSTFAGGLAVGTDKLVVDSTTGNIGIGTTSPYQKLSVAGNVIADTFIATSTAGTSTFAGALAVSGLSSFTLASTSRLSVFDYAWFGGSATSTFTSNGYLGILSAAPAYPLDVTGIGRFSSLVDASHFVATSTSATSTFAGGLAVGTSRLLVDSTTGRVGIGTTSPSGTLAVAGDFFLTGSTTITGADSGIVFTGSGNHDITALGGTLRIGTNTIIGNVEALNDTVDIGTPAVRFDKLYVNEVNASTIVGTLTGGNLSAETFTINSDNATADTENSYLAFERGTTGPNAVLTWNAAESAKRFELNHPLFIQNASASTTLTTLDLKSVAGQIADIFRVASSSSDTLFNVTSSGNVGIGTTTPWGQLSVNPNGITGPAFVVGSSTATNFIVTSGGNVGIGTASPSASLDIRGASGLTYVQLTNTAGNLAYYGIGQGVSTALFGVEKSTAGNLFGGSLPYAAILGNQSNYATQFATNNSVRMTISSAGNVGIGTSTPNNKLDIYSTTKAALGFNTNAGLSSWTIGQDASDGYKFKISSSTALGTNDRFVIDGNGSVGIGTTSPSTTLAVQGNGLFSGNLTAANITATGTLSVAGVITASAGSVSATAIQHPSNAGTGIYFPTANQVAFAANGSSNLTVTPAGVSVGGTVGVTITTAGNVSATSLNWGTNGTGLYGDATSVNTAVAGANVWSATASGLAVTGVLSTTGNITQTGGAIIAQNGAITGNGALLIGADVTASTLTDATRKIGVVSTPHYTNAQSKMLDFWSDSDATTNTITIGGGLAGFHAATNVNIYAAATNTGGAGASVAAFTSAGAAITGTLSATATTTSTGGIIGPNNFVVQQSSGKVGIGTTSPYTTLAVSAASPIGLIQSTGGVATLAVRSPNSSQMILDRGSTSLASLILLQTAGSNNWAIGNGVGRSTTDLQFWNYAGAEAMTIQSTTSNVGIGTTTPNSVLNIAGATPKLTLTDTGAGANLKHWFVQSNAGALRFATTSDALADNSLAAVTIGSGGNLLVGVASEGSSVGKIQLPAATGSANGIYFGSSNANMYQDAAGSIKTDGKFRANDTLIAGTGTLTGTGFKFLASRPMEVGSFAGGGTFTTIGASGNNLGMFATNVDFQNTNDYKYLSTATAAAVDFNTAAGGITFLTAPSGTAGNALTFTEQMRITAAGLVGIGTTTPWGKLSVTNTGTGPSFVVEDATSPDTTPFVIDATGNVGVGIASPSHKLQVVGSNNATEIKVSSADQGSGAILFGDGASALKNVGIWRGNANSYAVNGNWMNFGTYGDGGFVWATGNAELGSQTERMRLSAATGLVTIAQNLTVSGTGNTTIAGNVGIGTTTPGALLDIYGSSGPMLRLIDGGTAGTNADPHMTFRDGTSQMGAVGYTTSNSSNLFVTNSISGGHIVLSPTGAGNVGIGTTTPFFKLQVAGGSASAQIGISDTDSGVDGKHWTIQSLNSSGNAQLRFRAINDSLSSGINALVISRSGVSSVTSYFENGNVGIGTTSPDGKLHVYTSTAGDVAPVTSADDLIVESGGQTGITLLSPDASPASIAFGSPTDSFGALLQWTHDLDLLTIGTQNTGGDIALVTGNNAEAMRILDNGNVGIGTTPTQRLDINGITTFGGGNGYIRHDDAGVFHLQAGTSGYAFNNNGNNTTLVRILDGGNVGIGTTTPGSKLSVSGGLSVGANYGVAAPTNGLIVEGDVGLGKTSAAVKLDVSGSIRTSLQLQFGDTTSYIQESNGLQIVSGASRDLFFSAGAGGERVRIKNDTGNVGIGTTSPASKLAVSGGASIGANYNTAAPTNGLIVEGNVGVGTTSPSAPLSVYTAGAGNMAYFYGGTYSTDSGIRIEHLPSDQAAATYIDLVNGYGANQTTSRISTAGTGGVMKFHAGYNNPSATTAGFSFLVKTSGVDYERMTILNNGNVGIGTTSPGSLLHLSGINPELKIERTSSGDSTLNLFYQSNHNALVRYQPNVATLFLENNYPGTATLGDIVFKTRPSAGSLTEAVTIKSNGNVGIGTTTPADKLQVSGGMFVSGNTSMSVAAGQPSGLNLFYDTATSTLLSYDWSANAPKDLLLRGKTLSVRTGTFGNTEALYVANSGNVGIGTTAPGGKLEVAGSADTEQLIVKAYSGQTVANPILQLQTSAGAELMRITTDNIKNIFIGEGAGLANTITGTGSEGLYNTFIGSLSGDANTAGYFNSAYGYFSLSGNTTGHSNMAIGVGALMTNTIGNSNVAVGRGALTTNLSGSSNVAIGNTALELNSTGAANVAVGTSALSKETSSYNTAFGASALQNAVSTGFNTGIGASAGLSNTTGNKNTLLGYATDYYNQTGSGNTVLGYLSGGFGSGGVNSHSNNTVIGYQSGYNLSTGGNNIYLGSYTTPANANITTGSNNIIIGNDIQAPSATASNQLNIGNLIFATGMSGTGSTIAGNVGIGTTSPAVKLVVADSSHTYSRVDTSGTAHIAGSYFTTPTTEFDMMSFGGYNASRFGISTVGYNAAYAVTGGLMLGTYGASDVIIGSNNTDRIHILSTGNVGIGTTTPQSMLHLYQTGGPIITLQRAGSGTPTGQIYFNGENSGVVYGSLIKGYNGEVQFWNDATPNDTSNNLAQNVTITSAGLVGIGTTTPWGKLSVTNTGTGPSFVVEDATSPDTTPFVIDASGNVGIGISVPTARLHIDANAGTGGINIANMGSAEGYLTFDGRTDAGIFRSGSSGTVRIAANSGHILLQPGSNVGIGTTTPGAKLDVYGVPTTAQLARIEGASASTVLANDYAYLSLHNTNTTNSNYTSLYFDTNDTTGAYKSGAAIQGIYTSHSSVSGELAFSTNNAGTFGEKMRITAAGNVGIGTTTPAYKLDIAGFINTDQYSGYKQAGNTILYASTTNNTLAVGASEAAGWMSATTTQRYSVAVGPGALAATPTNVTAQYNTAVGYLSLTSNTTGVYNTANGALSLSINNTGFYNTATGYRALFSNTTGYSNTATGRDALSSNTTGYNNTADGVQALFYNQFATTTTALGAYAARGLALYGNQGGVYLGYQSGYNASTGSDYNTFLGYQSGYGVTTGSNNIWIGTATSSTAIANLTTGSQNILIGNNISLPSATASGQLNLGNIIFGTGITGTGSTLSAGNIGIGTTSPATLFEVGGSTANVTLDGYLNCTGFTSNANGLLACTASDERLKQNVVALDGASALAGLNALNPVSFYWNPAAERSSAQQYGLIAQQVQTVFPNLVATSSPTALTPDGTLSVNYEGLISPMVMAIQELDARTTFISNAATSTVLTVNAAGNVGIGTTTPNHTLSVAGDIGAIAFVNTSTRSAKTDIDYATASSSEDRLSQLVNLKVATYRYTIEDQNDPLRLGLIAEDTQTIAPEILSADGKGVDIYELATFTLSGVQALAAKVDAQETRMASLEDRINALESGAVSSASGSPITFSTSSLASALEGFGVLIRNGIAQFNTLVFRQLVASRDADGTSSAGSVTIIGGNTIAQVTNSLVQPSTKVFVTFNSSVTGSWWVSDKTNGSFRVVLSEPQSVDVSFDYFLVQTEGQIATSTPAVSSGSSSSSSGLDTTAPVITLLGDNPLHLSVGGTFVEPGVTVTDNADVSVPYITFVNGIEMEATAGSIDTSIQTTYIITYSATDARGNLATATRSVIVGSETATPSDTGSTPPASTDATAPVVSLTGGAALELTVGDTFTDPGATATDDTDGDVTSSIAVSGAVDTATEGLYTLTYTATDAAGNSGSASRVVTVVAAPAPAPEPAPAL